MIDKKDLKQNVIYCWIRDDMNDSFSTDRFFIGYWVDDLIFEKYIYLDNCYYCFQNYNFNIDARKITQFKLANKKQQEWLLACIKANKFLLFNENPDNKKIVFKTCL